MIMDNKLKDGKYVKEIIEKELDSMGLSKMLTGYEYISQAVVMTVFDIELLKGITKRLYPCIAHEFCTSGAAVERDIRTAISYVCKNGNRERLQKLVKPHREKLHFTNREFIFETVNSVKKKLHTVNDDKC